MGRLSAIKSAAMSGRSVPLLCLGRAYAAVATSSASAPAASSARLAFRRPIQQYHYTPRYNPALSSSSGSYTLLSSDRRRYSTPTEGGHKDPHKSIRILKSTLTDKKSKQLRPALPGTDKSISQSIDAANQKANNIGDKVRSLTPREQIYNIPNILTATRLVAAPFVGYLVLHEQHKWALALFAYAGITDLVDGWIARKYKLQTVVGSVIDPMADKFLMTVLTVTLSMNGLLPGEYASLPAPKTFKRYWDFSLPSAEVHPTTMSKYNTLLQLLLIGATLAYPVITADNHHLGVMHDIGLEKLDLAQFMTYFQILVAGTTAWSGLSYAFLKDAVKILGKDEQLKLKQGRRGRAIIGVTFGSVVVAAAYLALTKDLPKKKEEGVVA
ncbi:hypothetical protein E4T39_02102 [Aureobasidium subglaciale]|nr:hypothetical protein E4T39_02102 [Aureobasidium subglaciale]